MIANAKLAISSPSSTPARQRLAQQGVRHSGSSGYTGTKNKAYRTSSADELIGSDTVNTMPPATMDAYRITATPGQLEEDIAGARAVMDALPRAGISIDAYRQPSMMAYVADAHQPTLPQKRRTVLGGKLNAMSYKLPEELGKDVQAAIDWRKEGKVRRLWPPTPRCD